MSNPATQKDFHYAPAVIGLLRPAGLLTPDRAREIISIAEGLISKTSFADEVHWGAFDVWNEYDKLILKDVADWDLLDYGGYYGFVRNPSKPLRTPSTGPHYAITEEDSFALFYDDYGHVNTDDQEWADLLHAIIDAVTEIEVVSPEDM